MLVFLDLVAHLLVMNVFNSQGRAIPPEMNFYQHGFKLHLFVSFQSRAQAIGLELIEALEKLNASLKLDNFTATVRLSETEGPRLPRWTPEYIQSELAVYAGNIQKIWVCGPPAMNELFDKTLGGLLDKLQIAKN